MRKRLVALAATVSLLVSLGRGLSVEAATTQYTVWQDADVLHSDGSWTVNSGNGAVTVTDKKAYSGNAYAWNRGTAAGVSDVALNVTATGGSGEDALVFWADTTEQPEATAIYAVKLYTKGIFSSTNVFRIKSGASATLVADGSTRSLSCSANELYLPAGVTGWVVLPFSSFQKESGWTSSISSGAVYSMQLQTETAYNSVLYIDDIGFATDDTAFINAACNGTLSAKRPSACDVYGHNWNAPCTEAAVCTRCDTTRGAGSHSYKQNVCSVCGYGRYDTHLGGGYFGATADNTYFRTAINSNTKVSTSLENENATVKRLDAGTTSYGSSIVWTRPDANKPTGILLSADKGQAEDEGVAVWLNMGDTASFGTPLRFMLRDFAGETERCWRVKDGAIFYSVMDGKVKKHCTKGAQFVQLPEDFVGWLVVPYEAFEWQWGVPSGQTEAQQALDPAQVQRVNLYHSRPSTYGSRIEVDEFGYFTDLRGFLRTVTNNETVLNKLDGMAPDTVWAEGTGAAWQYTEDDRLRVSADGGSVCLGVHMRTDDVLCVSDAEQLRNFQAIGLAVSADDGTVFKPLLLQADGTALSVSEDVGYYLVNEKTGLSYVASFGADGSVQIPAAFDGWVVLDTDAFATDYDMTQIRALKLAFMESAEVYLDTLYAASSAAGLITNVLGYPTDTDLFAEKDPSKAAITVITGGERLISLYGRMSSAAFRQAVKLRNGYRLRYRDAAGKPIYGALTDMSSVAEVDVYLGNVWQTTYLLTVATGDAPCESLGHNWVGGSCTVAGACAVCGVAQTAAGHTWADATCSTPKTCQNCYLTVGEPLTHNWMAANCGNPAMCRYCGLTEGAPAGGEHTWQWGACSVCGKNLVTVAQSFENSDGVSYSTANSYRRVTSANRFGSKSLRIQSGTVDAQVNINFNQFGQSTQTALAFRYDLTDSGYTGAEFLFYVYPRDGGGNLITLSNQNTYYIATGGKVTARTSGEHMGVKLPNGTEGWVILPIPGNSSWQNSSAHDTYYGTMKWLYGINIRLPQRNGPAILVDHFVYVEDVQEFASLAAAGDGNVTGYIPVNGDLDGDGVVTASDAVYLLYHTMLPEVYPANQNGDYTGDGKVDSEDAVYLLYHALLPQEYPLR